jgi:CubicO group peptidase (beta-lactamase class C family)
LVSVLIPALIPVTTPLAAQTADEARQALARVKARLEPEIRRGMLEGQIPSITVALTDRAGELWAGAFGESNLWARTPASTQTVYLIGSTFKAQSTIALLQQMEAGKFQLDDRVNDYLTVFQIRGEDPENPLTFRHLLTHTSGLPAAYGGHDVWGVPYKEYIQDRIWGPLGMTSTAFAPTPGMEERLSMPYVLDRDTERPVASGRTKANVWPAGIVYGTVHDQASWVRFNLGDGAVRNERLLQPATMNQMHVIQFPEFAGNSMSGGWGYENPGYGLTWWLTERDGEKFFAHSGSVSGYTAFVMGNRTRGFGVAVLTNGNRAHPHLVRISNLALDLLAEELGESR